MSKKRLTKYLYTALGFPIVLLNVPVRTVFGETVLDINLARLQERVFYVLLHKPSSLSGDELKYIRKYLKMTKTDFGKMVGVSYAAVINWENGRTPIAYAIDKLLRLTILDSQSVKDKEFRKLFHELTVTLFNKGSSDSKSLEINVNNLVH